MAKKRKRTSRKRSTSRRSSQRPSNDFGLDLNLSDIELPSLLGEEKKIDPNKLSKPQLIDILVQNLSSEDIYEALMKVGKIQLAKEFKHRVDRIHDKYEKVILAIEGKEEETAEKTILKVIIEEIIRHMRNIYSLSFKPIDEYDFHKQLEPFLIGLVSPLEDSLSKFGMDVHVYREYELPSGERIDFMITVGKFNIGVEVKYDPKRTSEQQRLLGQMDRYGRFLDTLIVISYEPLNHSTVKIIKDKGELLNLPTVVVTKDEIY